MGSPAELSGPDEVAAGSIWEPGRQQPHPESMTLQCWLEGEDGCGLETARARQVSWEGSTHGSLVLLGSGARWAGEQR